MGKIKIVKKLIIFVLLLSCIFLFQNTYANQESNFKIGYEQYSEEYKKWLELPEEEKNKVIAPRMYDIEIQQSDNRNILFNNSNIPYYNLKDIIPENIAIRNQMQTNSCWAFSTLATLESTLGLQNYHNKKQAVAYDFSERHMEYSTSKTFLNNEINSKGFNRSVGSGGNPNIAIAYLTNGMGAINEEDMPFENNENQINFNDIKNKNVTSKIIDTVDFPSVYNKSFNQKEYVNEQLKNHLINNGGIMAAIHGAQSTSEYYNLSTGAIYCDDSEKCKPNHQVEIIGWDDNYSIDNFNINHRPQNPGAWIIKNSWGTEYGKDGIAYVSYEDVNIYYWLVGIENASSIVDYDNIYQYNELGYNMVGIIYYRDKIYLANDFQKKSNKKEYISEVSIFVPETDTCKVFVNANGTDKSKENLIQVELKDGEEENLGIGYHTLEFKEPIEILSDSFTIVIEIQSLRENTKYCLENNVGSSLMQNAEIANGNCFLTDESGFLSNQWKDLSDDSFFGTGSDSTIKVFTIIEKNVGDINGDNEVTAKDLNILYSYLKGTKEFTKEEKERADVTEEGDITAKDLNALFAHLNGTKLLF